jgi:hypothetical protein
MNEKEKIEEEYKLHEEFRQQSKECDLCDKDACREQDENSSDWRWCTLYNKWLIETVTKERQAKEELVKYLEICKEVIKRYVAFNSSLMDAKDKENTNRLDNELSDLINKHKEKEICIYCNKEITQKDEGVVCNECYAKLSPGELNDL